jgi:hypothetical protein
VNKAKAMKTIIFSVLVSGASLFLSAGASAQSLQLHPDTAFAAHSDNKTIPLPGQVHLTKNFSIQTNLPNHLSLTNINDPLTGSSPGAMGNAASMGNPAAFNLRREVPGFRGVLLNMQNFRVGTSYNGLNSLMRSGFSGDMPQGSRNGGLSIHAGIHF